MHGKVFDNTNDKEGYAKALGKPVAIIVGIWFLNIQRRFS